MRVKKIKKPVKKMMAKKNRPVYKAGPKRAKILLNRKNSSEIYKKLLITSSDAVTITDLDGNIMYASERAAHIYGAAGAQELIGKSSFIFIAPENREKFLLNIKRTLKEGFLSGVEYTFLQKDGSRFLGAMNISAIKDAKGKAVALLGSIRDVTRNRQMEGRLKKTEENYKAIFNGVNDAIMILDPRTGGIIDANKKAAEMKGCTYDELKAKGLKLFMPDTKEEEYERVLDEYRKAVEDKGYHVFEWRNLKKDGCEQWVEMSLKKDRIDGEDYLLAIARDITDRKRTEKEIRNSEEMFRSLIDASPDAVFVADSAGMILYASDKALELYGVPRMDMLVGKNASDFSANDEKPRVLEAFGKVVREGNAHNFEVVIIRHNNEKVTGEANATLIKTPDGAPKAVMVTIRDITEKKKMEIELKQSYMAVKKVMDGIIIAMEKLVEKKDTYTVGHQHRTAQLARAIAKEMGLSPEQMNCVYISALIHDIGKIFVSGSILNKVGSLTPEEYEIIKKHPAAGYDVLKSIDFPWPIADIILQHHERLDGSGYPYGLTGDKIYLESRIISVADVVEAITFARPYRPACGIDVALGEITANKGKLFDVEVVDICVNLMKEQGFKFEQNT